jgi:hypothetical protein
MALKRRLRVRCWIEYNFGEMRPAMEDCLLGYEHSEREIFFVVHPSRRHTRWLCG